MGKYYAGKRKSSSRGWLRRGAKRVYKAASKRYAPGGKLDVQKIQSDINYVKSIATTAYGLLNTEKKRNELNFYGRNVGQVNGTASGHDTFEITPAPSQGNGYGNRTGGSISFRSSYIACQVIQQPFNQQPMRLMVRLIMTTNGDAFDATEFLQYNRFLYATNSVAIYDSLCDRDPDFFRKYKVIRQKMVTLKADATENATNGYNYVVNNFKMLLNFGKYGHHVRFDNNTSTSTGKRFFILVTADTGNIAATDSTLNNIGQYKASTGATTNWIINNYYIDN